MEGVIIKWPLNRRFHERRDIIIMFWTNVLGVDDDATDNELSIFTLKWRYKSFKWRFLTFFCQNFLQDCTTYHEHIKT